MQADLELFTDCQNLSEDRSIIADLGIQSGQVKNNLHMALDSYNLVLILNF